MSVNAPFVLSLVAFTSLLIAGLAGAWLCRREPSRAHGVLIASTIFAVMAATISIATPVPEGPVVSTTSPNPPWQALPGRPLDTTIRDTVATDDDLVITSPIPDSRTATSWTTLWIVASLLLIISRLPGLLASMRLLRQAQPVQHSGLLQTLRDVQTEMQLRGQVRLLCSQETACPVIWCWLRPAVLIPSGFEYQSPDQWRSTFLHELAHLRRRDHISSLLTGLITFLVPWHPLVWISQRGVRRFSEQACDETVLSATGTQPVRYAETLLHFTSRLRPALLNSMGSQPSETVVRVKRVLAWNNTTKSNRSKARLFAVAVLFACGLFASPMLKQVMAGEAETSLSSTAKAEWIERLTSTPENARWYVGANLGRELSTLPGRANVEILRECWTDIADDVRPQLLKGFMPAFKKTDGISDGLFDILDLARQDTNSTVRDFSIAYLGSLTFSFDPADDREYETWRKTTKDKSTTEVVVSETRDFVAGLPALSKSEARTAMERVGQSANTMREFSAMRDAAIDAGLLTTVKKWVEQGWIQSSEPAVASLQASMKFAGVAAPAATSAAPTQDDSEFAGYPLEDVTLDRRKRKRYFLMGPPADQKPPANGWKLLLVLPGGDGGADFQSFSRRIHMHALPEGYIAAQLVAPVWSKNPNRVVWPTRKLNPDRASFTTESFVGDVVKDISKRLDVDTRNVFALGWSSGGPPLYSASLDRRSPLTGTMIAMSVFKPKMLPSLRLAKGRSYYLLHSPDDFINIDQHPRTAQRLLTKAGASVELQTYGGGHGWREDPFGHIRRGVEWLEQQASSR